MGGTEVPVGCSAPIRPANTFVLGRSPRAVHLGVAAYASAQPVLNNIGRHSNWYGVCSSKWAQRFVARHPIVHRKWCATDYSSTVATVPAFAERHQTTKLLEASIRPVQPQRFDGTLPSLPSLPTRGKSTNAACRSPPILASCLRLPCVALPSLFPVRPPVSSFRPH